MNSYNGAVAVKNYLMHRWSTTIEDRDNDAPRVFGKARWSELALGGGHGSAVVWEGFYEWTKPSEIAIMQSLLNHTNLEVFPTAEWMVEIYSTEE